MQIKAMRRRMGSGSHWVIYTIKIFKLFYSLTQDSSKHFACSQPFQEIRTCGDTVLRHN